MEVQIGYEADRFCVRRRKGKEKKNMPASWCELRSIRLAGDRDRRITSWQPLGGRTGCNQCLSAAEPKPEYSLLGLGVYYVLCSLRHATTKKTPFFVVGRFTRFCQQTGISHLAIGNVTLVSDEYTATYYSTSDTHCSNVTSHDAQHHLASWKDKENL